MALAGIVFVGRSIANQWQTVRYELTHAEPLWIVLGVVTAAVAMVCMALPWRQALALVGARV